MKNSEAMKAGATIRSRRGVSWRIEDGAIIWSLGTATRPEPLKPEDIFAILDNTDNVSIFGYTQDWSEVVARSILEVIND